MGTPQQQSDLRPDQLPDSEALKSLKTVRRLRLEKSENLAQYLPTLLTWCGPHKSLDLRRWGASFLAELAASPSTLPDEKRELSLNMLQTLKEFLDKPDEDAAVVKSAVEAATSIYPVIFLYIIYNPGDRLHWQYMAAIKSNILRRMDVAPAGVKVCCIKFIQKVVLVQTSGHVPPDNRNEVSLALVPYDHPLIPPPKLEAEATGLLDRLLSVFQDAPSDALLVTATLNNVGVLVRTRGSISNRILNAILNFSPFRVVTPVVSPRMKVVVKSMERTVRAFLINLNKRNPNGPWAGKIVVYLERLHQLHGEFLAEGSRKRPAPAEPTDGLDQNKRQRLGAALSNTPPQVAQGPPQGLPSGPISLAQLFTLTEDEGARTFNVRQIPEPLMLHLICPILQSVDRNALDIAINVVRERFQYLVQHQAPSPADAATSATETAGGVVRPTEDAEQVMNGRDGAPVDDIALIQRPEVSLGPFILPSPVPLTRKEIDEGAIGLVARVFGRPNGLVDASSRTTTSGFMHRANYHDKDSWRMIGLARAALRSFAGLEIATNGVKTDGVSDGQVSRSQSLLSSSFRESMHTYVLSDFRKRIDVGITWLNEEWYNDQVQRRAGGHAMLHYDALAIKLFDGMSPFLDGKDLKMLTRFLSEIPSVTRDMVDGVKRLARDPERVSLSVNSLYYLVRFRPPLRGLCIDALEDLYRNYDEAKTASEKLLRALEPQRLQPDEKALAKLEVGDPA